MAIGLNNLIKLKDPSIQYVGQLNLGLFVDYYQQRNMWQEIFLAM